MHLIELIALLESRKVERGNIKLVDVSIVAAGDREALVDFTDRAQRVKIHKLSIDVTGMHEEQVDELRAEHPDAEFFTMPPETSTAAGERCNVVDTTKGQCTLEIGHEVEHAYEHAEKLSTEAQIEKDKGWPAGTVTEVDGKLVARCIVWDGKGHQCTREPHAGDGEHVFQAPVPAEALAETMNAAAAKLPPEATPEAIAEQEKHDAETAPPEVDALKAHEDHQAQLAAEAEKRDAAHAAITRANAIEGEQPETLQE